MGETVNIPPLQIVTVWFGTRGDWLTVTKTVSYLGKGHKAEETSQINRNEPAVVSVRSMVGVKETGVALPN
jgi:hypothetical protein